MLRIGILLGLLVIKKVLTACTVTTSNSYFSVTESASDQIYAPSMSLSGWHF